MRVLLACVLASFSSSALAEQPTQFDLRCNGIAKTETQKMDGPFQRVVHVDLSSNQYCNDECASVHRIASVDPVKIAFEWDPVSAYHMNRVTVDRRTGEYLIAQSAFESGKWILGRATCSPAPFTAFPATRF